MPALIYFSVRFVFRVLIAILLFALTYLRRVYDSIRHFNFRGIIMADSRPIHLFPSITIRSAENNAPQELNTTVLAIESIEDTSSAQKGPEENVENKARNKEQEDNNEIFLASNEQQSMGTLNSSNVAANTNEGNAHEENQNNADEMIVATLACFLECCDMCQIL